MESGLLGRPTQNTIVTSQSNSLSEAEGVLQVVKERKKEGGKEGG
jgi:hypothetical protein